MGLLEAIAGPWDPGAYWLVRWLLRRGLASLYLVAFLVAAFQFRPLAGEDGLLPLQAYVERVPFRKRPGLLHLVPSDRAATAMAWTGAGLALLALVGLPGLLLGTIGTVLAWGGLWVLYLSFVNAGQTFWGFGWESMLLEAGFLAIFLGAPAVATPAVVVWLFRWVCFRNMFGAGLIKLRGDNCWSDLTCLDYHYETQPMPNPVSWYAHRFPAWFQRLGVATNHAVELVVPFFYFAPQPIATVAGLVTIGFQGWLIVTGNFAWLNWLTIVLAFSTFDDDLLTALPGVDVPAVAPIPLPLLVAVGGLTVLVLALSYYPVANMVSSDQRMNASFDPLHVVNTYGAFGSITKTRYEIVVQGTHDETLDDDTTWETYEFKGKPTDPGRRPPQVAPYHLRLDWQLWFAAMSPSPARHPWFVHLVAKLLDGDEAVTGLLLDAPFDTEDPPTHVRALRYRYRFTTPSERAESGQWWHRERVGTYFGPVAAEDPELRLALRRRGWD